MSIYNRYDILTEFAKKKKSNARTCLNGAKDATGASQTFDAAKVQFFFELSKFILAKMRKIAKFISFAMRIFAKLYASVQECQCKILHVRIKITGYILSIYKVRWDT